MFGAPSWAVETDVRPPSSQLKPSHDAGQALAGGGGHLQSRASESFTSLPPPVKMTRKGLRVEDRGLFY